MDDEPKQRSLRQAKRKAIEALDTSIVNLDAMVLRHGNTDCG